MKIFSQNLPDIDKLVRDFVDKLTGKKKPQVFSSRGNGGEEPPENGDDDGRGEGEGIALPPLGYILTMLMGGVVVIWVLSGFFTVDASERAVMFRLGQPSGVKTPGLVWHMPLIEDYRIVNLSEVRRVEVGFRDDAKRKDPRESLMLTGDLNIIDMQFVVQYALNDPEQFLFENRFGNIRAEDVVKQVAETAMREVAGQNEIDFVLYEGRESVASQTLETMQNILNRYKTGIQVREVAIQNVQPPDQVQDAFEDAIKARKDRDRKINEGKAYANDILPRSQGQAARYLEDAEAYRRSVTAKASGDAARFLLVADEYRKAPEVTRRRLYLETMESVFSRANKVMIDQPDSGNLLYLPLDKLMQGAAAPLRDIDTHAPGAGISSGGGVQQGSSGVGGVGVPASLDELKERLRQSGRSALDAVRGGGQR